MKNLVYFLAFAVFAFACGDDDEPTPPPPTPMDFSAYINSGGPAVNTGGVDWEVDDNMQNSDAAETFSTAELNPPQPDMEIAGTEDDALYRTEVYDLDVFTYNIAVPGEATLEVKLHFAEIFHGISNSNGAGARTFDVDIESGQGTLTDYDIFAAAGGAAIAKVETFSNVSVTDGNLTITFTTKTDAAKVNAVEVTGTYITP